MTNTWSLAEKANFVMGGEEGFDFSAQAGVPLFDAVEEPGSLWGILRQDGRQEMLD